MTETHQTPEPKGPQGPNLKEVADAFLGWQSAFFRTTFDSLIRPEAVAQAALNSDTSRYASPLRLFIFLFSILMAITAFISNDSLISIERLLAIPRESLEGWMTAHHTLTLDELNNNWSGWMNFIVWPVMVLSASPYILVFKAFAPSRTLYGASLVYLVTTNGMIALQALLQLGLSRLLPMEANTILTTLIVILIYFYISGRVIFSLYAKTVLGGVVKLAVIIALTPVTFILTGVLYTTALGLFLLHGHDISMLELIELSTGGPSS